MEVINIKKALERLDGDRELLEDLWSVFLEYCPGQLARLKEAMALPDFAAAQKEAHSLKGAAANIGAERLQEAAFQVELASKDSDGEKVCRALEIFEKEFALVMAFLGECAAGLVRD